TGSSKLVELTSDGKSQETSMKIDFRQQGSEGRLYLSANKVSESIRCQSSLARNIPLTLNIKSAASNLELNLSQLQVTELRLDINAGNCRVTMPFSPGATPAYIKANVANIEVIVPDGIAAKVQANTNLSIFNINEGRFPGKGSNYMSRDFESAKKQLNLVIDGNISRVQVD
ncbi:hypothetical protein ACFLTZ_02545, partial [Chloroflexota bacterium]